MSASAFMASSDGSMAGTLRALASAGPLHEQNLMLINIQAIQAELGARWDAKRDSVWAQVEKFLRHEFGAEDVVVRLDDLNALVVQPSRSPLAAQTRCIQAAYDLMRFFLGDGAHARGAVKRVTEVDGDQVTSTVIPPEQVAAVTAARDTERWAPCAAIRCPILTPIGRSLIVEVSLAPILTLQAGRNAGGFGGYHVRAVLEDAGDGRVLDASARAGLRSCDLASVDVLVLGAAFAQRALAPHPAAPLVAPVSSHTLAHSSARYAFLEAAHRLTAVERNSLALEVGDLEPGTPAGRLGDLVAIARPHCRGVICRMEVTASNAEKAKSAGATLSLPPASEPPTEASLLRQASGYAAAAKLVHGVLLHEVPSDLAPVAAIAGATHCTLGGQPPAAPAERLQAT